MIVAGNDGDVITDFASTSKLKMRALPPRSGSEYFDVSHRVIHGCVPSSSRRSHFTLVLPSKPGSSRRNGNPCSGRSGSPFCAHTIIASSNAFSIGMLRVNITASLPSARNHFASGFAPTSSNSTASAARRSTRYCS